MKGGADAKTACPDFPPGSENKGTPEREGKLRKKRKGFEGIFIDGQHKQ